MTIMLSSGKYLASMATAKMLKHLYLCFVYTMDGLRYPLMELLEMCLEVESADYVRKENKTDPIL